MMELITQPNGWTCGPCTMAMCLRVTLEEAIAAIGHDGSARVDWEEIPDRRAGFNEADLTLGALRLGYGMVRLPTKPMYSDGTFIPNWPEVRDIMKSVDGPMSLIVASERFPGCDHNIAIQSAWSGWYYDPAKTRKQPIESLPPVKTIEWFVPLSEEAKLRWKQLETLAIR